MSNIKFIYGNNVLDITDQDTDKIGSALKIYKRIMEEKDILFLYKGKNILENKDILKKFKKKNRVNITVIKKNKNKIKDEIGSIICPKCRNLAFFNINEDNIIKLDNCINQHKNEYSINEFIENQEYKEKEIICDICKNDQSLYNENFFICSCKKSICQLCMANHMKKKEHNLLYYNKRYSCCNQL